MNLRIKLEPYKHESTCRHKIYRDIMGSAYTQVAVAPVTEDDCYIVYSIHKVRGRTITEYYKNGKVKRKTYKPTHYVGYSYRVHQSLLKLAKLKIVRTKTGNKLVKVSDPKYANYWSVK